MSSCGCCRILIILLLSQRTPQRAQVIRCRNHESHCACHWISTADGAPSSLDIIVNSISGLVFYRSLSSAVLCKIIIKSMNVLWGKIIYAISIAVISVPKNYLWMASVGRAVCYEVVACYFLSSLFLYWKVHLSERLMMRKDQFGSLGSVDCKQSGCLVSFRSNSVLMCFFRNQIILSNMFQCYWCVFTLNVCRRLLTTVVADSFLLLNWLLGPFLPATSMAYKCMPVVSLDNMFMSKCQQRMFVEQYYLGTDHLRREIGCECN